MVVVVGCCGGGWLCVGFDFEVECVFGELFEVWYVECTVEL